MRNITLSAEAALIDKARRKAQKEHRSLNVVFREWLKRYIGQESAADNYVKFMKKVRYAYPGRKFSRDEMNER